MGFDLADLPGRTGWSQLAATERLCLADEGVDIRNPLFVGSCPQRAWEDLLDLAVEGGSPGAVAARALVTIRS